MEHVDRIKELSILYEISKSMHTLDLNEILELVLAGVTKAIGFDRARLYLIDEKENNLRCRMAYGIEKEKIEGIKLPLDKSNSMLARSVIEREPFIVEDASKDPRVNKDLKTLFNLKSFAVVPLMGRDRVLGAITADNLESDRKITNEKFESLIIFANQAGIALENAKMYKELKAFSGELEERVEKATDELRKAQDKLIEQEKLAALGKLSAGIAHEIRNPLTSIKVLIHSIAEKIADSKTKEEDIAVLTEEIERVEGIVKRFLDFSRPSGPKFAKINLNNAVEETVNLISYDLIRDQNIVIEREFSKIPDVQADKEQMKQVLLNLFLNAIQAMPEGGTLTVRTRTENGNVKIEVADEGEGIPEDVKQKLFEPFFTTKEEGIGLGLSIVKRIVDDHKGTVSVADNSPKGTVFTIKLKSEES